MSRDPQSTTTERAQPDPGVTVEDVRDGGRAPRAVVLLSGGLDSATALAIARSRGFETYALTVRYGQRHEVELAAAGRVAAHQGATEHREVRVDLGSFGGSALTDEIPVPKAADRSPNTIPATYVPARNTVLLAVALAWAEVVEAQAIFIGVNAVDYSGYPDCRPEFVDAFKRLAAVATKSAVTGSPVGIEAPLMDLSKAQIIQMGIELGVDYALTTSCYDPGPGGAPCRACEACELRRQGFQEAGLPDPALG